MPPADTSCSDQASELSTPRYCLSVLGGWGPSRPLAASVGAESLWEQRPGLGRPKFRLRFYHRLWEMTRFFDLLNLSLP